jgi:uncharacterized protein (DUF885 family)
MSSPAPEHAAALRRTVDALAARIWQHKLSREPHLQARRGMAVEKLPAETLEDAERDARFAGELLREAEGIDGTPLGHETWLTLEFVKEDLRRVQLGPDLWWEEFPVTPYMASSLALYGQLVYRAFAFASTHDVERYHALLEDYAARVRCMGLRLQRQAGRGWRVPRPALAGVRATLRGLRAGATRTFAVDECRLSHLDATARARLRNGIERALNDSIDPAFGALLGAIGEDYERTAPESVGLWQYPGGEIAYRRQVLRHVTLDIAPERVRALGLEQVARLTEEMRAQRAALGFSGTESDFLAHLRAAGRMHVRNAGELEQRYRRCIERMRPLVKDFFSREPRAPYDVERLDPAMEPGMSYGYYEPPAPANPAGRYRYNGSGLETRSQLSAAALIYHELVPGHHFHLARQAENESLPDLRREAIDLAIFNEGWAEYASGLAGEMGLYDDPYDAYGRLVHERFTAQRLVVDTGLNAFGWSLERARAYMREHTHESETQIASETLRYATDLPAQALAYRLGFLEMRALRERAEVRLGAAFDLREFHETVLAPGALPLPLLERHVDRFIEERAAA